jgi:hypothetical protein
MVIYHGILPRYFYNIGPWPLYYKTFYGRNLRMFVISYGVCPWQAFQA